MYVNNTILLQADKKSHVAIKPIKDLNKKYTSYILCTACKANHLDIFLATKVS